MAVNTISKVAGVTLSGSTNNEVVTVTGGNSLTGESNLTFDGTTLVNSGQGVGVGESPSTWGTAFDFIQVGGTMALSSQPNVQASQAAWITQNAHYDVDNSWEYQATDEAGRFGMSSGVFTFDTAASGSAGTDISWSESMRLDANGNLTLDGSPTSARVFATTSAAGNNVFRGNASSGSYAGDAQYMQVGRAANSAYDFLDVRSSSGSDSEFRLRGDGNGYADASWNNSGADYQEYFESQSGVAAEVGRTVVLDGDQIRYYNAATDSADDIVGVTRPEADNKNSAVVGNLAWNHWTDKYLTDDWGVYEREDITVYQWEVRGNVEDGEDGISVTHTVQQYSSLWLYSHGDVVEYVPVGSVTIPADAVQTTDNVRKLNPAFDPAQEANYKSREDRDEWWLIGLLGQIQIKAGEPTNPRWIKMKDISANVELWYVR